MCSRKSGTASARIILATLISLCSHSVYAGFIDFTDGYGFDLLAFDKAISGTGGGVGVLATFTDNVKETTFPGAHKGFLVTPGRGLALGSGNMGTSWNVTFDHTVVLTGWSSEALVSGVFDITGPGVEASFKFSDSLNPLPSPLTFLAHESYAFSTPARCCQSGVPYSPGGTLFSRWNFDADPRPIPVPSSILLIGLGLFAIRRRVGK